jgi:hypothetical protein
MSKPEYFIIDLETPSELQGGCSARGPYASVKEAEAWLKNDCRETYLDADKSCRELDGMAWGAPMIIAQVIRYVQPCPKISVTVTLRDVDKDNKANREA